MRDNLGPFSPRAHDPLYPCYTCIEAQGSWGFKPMKYFTLLGPADLHRPKGDWIIVCPANHQQEVSRETIRLRAMLVYRWWFSKHGVTGEDRRGWATRGLALLKGKKRVYGLLLWSIWDREGNNAVTRHRLHFVYPRQ